MALNKLAEWIACYERSKGEEALHSFAPEPWPDNVSQVPPTADEEQAIREATTERARQYAVPAARKYLPCHYFDYICGSSTGA